ncbi:MAG TPA: SUMF1/EgtB/PvdO family nonheme iron enzyme [Kofleriaceae bacterium]|nr:SUMF1/EgtB/PvdO family nonheme iron enzyme [Kofleriaceae bacterium]
MRRHLIALLLLPAVAAPACTAEVDYDGTEYRCTDGVTCPDGSECIDQHCLVDPGPRAMIAVPETSFVMGCDPADVPACDEDSAPAHEVTVSAFELDPTEVSQLDYWRCVDDGACAAPGTFTPGESPDLPVTLISWDDADGFCAWAGKRLATEAEWEVAARGAAGATFPWGEEPPACDLAQFSGCAPEQPIAVGTPVGDASSFGISGLAGNVAEWVGDWYGAEYYAESPARDPTGPTSGTERVVRGASFNDTADELPSWQREGDEPIEIDDDTGARCARSAAPRATASDRTGTRARRSPAAR